MNGRNFRVQAQIRKINVVRTSREHVLLYVLLYRYENNTDSSARCQVPFIAVINKRAAMRCEWT